MARYKQKPIEVDARQYTGKNNNGANLAAWVTAESNTHQRAFWYESRGYESGGVSFKLSEIFTLIQPDGKEEFARVSDWVVKVDGSFYIFSDAEFQKRFDKA